MKKIVKHIGYNKIEITLFAKRTKKSPRCRIYCECGCKSKVDLYYITVCDGKYDSMELNGVSITKEILLQILDIMKKYG